MKRLFLLIIFIASSCIVFSQEGKVPSGIAEHFYMQYPYATHVKVNKKWQATDVEFYMNNEHYIALYAKDQWQYTLMDYSFNRVPLQIKKSLKDTRYGNSDVMEAADIYLPGGYEEYRLMLKEDSFSERYVYFNENGKIKKVIPVK